MKVLEAIFILILLILFVLLAVHFGITFNSIISAFKKFFSGVSLSLIGMGI